MQLVLNLENAETLLGSEGILIDSAKVNAALTSIYSKKY